MSIENYSRTIPFFVVDRPVSLNILDYCEICGRNEYFGLMTHAYTSKNFQALFREFGSGYENIVKACDSGVFTKKGCMLNYESLFKIYDNMDVNYGIMIDFLNDKDETIKSAAKAVDIYENEKHDFTLVGVAQGNNITEYLDCYEELRSLGFKRIAVGGLLKKNINSARYVKVKNEAFLKDVLKAIKDSYGYKEWLFALGCYHPKRQALFDELNIYGADYKGWILNYKTPKKILEMKNNELKENEKGLNISNLDLSSLLKEKESLSNKFRLKKTKAEKKELENELHSLEHEILLLRKEIANELNDEEYSFNLKEFEKFLNMTKEDKQKHRFNQVKGYLYRNVFSHFKDNLLIISCSQSKSEKPNPGPAIDIYDGPFYKMFRKTDKKISDNVHLMIISAKYGIIGPYDPIEKYNKKMTRKRAEKLNEPLKKELSRFLNENNFSEVFISLGKDYKLAIEGTDFGMNVKEAEGRIGEKLSQTKKWLNSI